MSKINKVTGKEEPAEKAVEPDDAVAPAADEVAVAAPAAPEREERGGRGGRGGKRQRRKPAERKESDFVEKVVAVNRVSKVVKGGKNFSFSALVVVGDGKGRVGFSVGKAREVQDAIRKGLMHAKNSMFRVPMKGVTIPHEIIGEFGAARVLLKPASLGTGVISGAAVRAVCECAGIKDILTKSLGSETPINVIRATVTGFKSMITEVVEAPKS